MPRSTRNAKPASTTSTTVRIGPASMVFQAIPARSANNPKPIADLLPSPTKASSVPTTTQIPLPDRTHWCTGEDSNLRSSQGAADLQSAAINRSATCAHPAGTPTRHFLLPANPRHSNRGHRRLAVFAHCGMRELANALTTPGGTLWDGNAEKTSETLRFRPQFFSLSLWFFRATAWRISGAGEGT
jgi:hypothetical protein